MSVRAMLGVLAIVVSGLSGQVRGDELHHQVRYDDHRLIIVEVDSQQQIEVLDQVGILLACQHGPGAQEMVVAPERLGELDVLGFAYRVVHEDYQQLIDLREAQDQQARALRGATFHDSYHPYPEIEAYLDTIVAINPAIASKQLIGQSLEGRDMYAVVITGASGGNPPQLVVNAGQHAREWVAPAGVLWIMEELVAGYGVDPEITALLDQVEWHFIPVVNPDGYQYSHTNQRLWRKNRRNNGNGTFGVDLNRNWGYQWGQGPSGSSSATPSSEIYRGPSAFSEPETQVARDYIQGLTNVKGHVDVHSYGQLILGPWGWTDQLLPPRADELVPVQQDMQQVMTSVFGETYLAGLGTDQLLYTADGIMPDWTFGSVGALSWTYEVRPNSSFPGFELPATEIVPTAIEVFSGLKVLAEFIQRPLVITVGGVPSTIQTGEPLEINATISGANGNTLDAGTEKIFYRYGSSGPFNEITMSGAAPDFSGQIPGGPCGSTIEFYVEAQASNGSPARVPADAPASVLTVNIENLTVALSDDFEINLGWSTSSNASSGFWERGVPVNDPGWQYDPVSDGDGSGQCFVTQNAFGNTDVDNGEVTLVSPAIDMSAGEFEIQYQYYLYLTDEDGSDRLLVEIDGNGGAGPWFEIARHDTNGGTGWRDHVIGQAVLEGSGVVLSSDTRIRFRANDAGTQSIVEAGIDQFVVNSSAPCPPESCAGNINGDGSVDLMDLNLVLGNFGNTGAPGIPGDANGDGSVDVTDLNLVIGNFGQSCLP